MPALAIENDVMQRWSQRRQRAADLEARWPFASEVLAFYGKLLAVQEDAFGDACTGGIDAVNLGAFAAERVVPRVVEVSAAEGPQAMMASVLEVFEAADFEQLIGRWLHDEPLSAIERYVTRAAGGPVLEAFVAGGGKLAHEPSERRCPACGGLPQVSSFATSREDLVTAHRYLACARCATSWAYARMTCAACGESETAKLEIYAELGTAQAELSGKIVKPGIPEKDAVSSEGARLPHLRIDACRSCSHYILNVDLERDGRAVPLVDELAALPLDLYAKERGFTKIVPNLMGF